jgi:hypothetical protein
MYGQDDMINNIVACRSVVYHAYVLTVKVTYPMSSQLHIYIYIYIYIQNIEFELIVCWHWWPEVILGLQKKFW